MKIQRLITQNGANSVIFSKKGKIDLCRDFGISAARFRSKNGKKWLMPWVRNFGSALPIKKRSSLSEAGASGNAFVWCARISLERSFILDYQCCDRKVLYPDYQCCDRKVLYPDCQCCDRKVLYPDRLILIQNNTRRKLKKHDMTFGVFYEEYRC